MRLLYATIQILFTVCLGVVIVWAGRDLLIEPSNIHTVGIYKIGNLTESTWGNETAGTKWLKTNFALLKSPRAYNYEKQVKIPILGQPNKGFYRDPFVNGDETLDYFCNNITGQLDAKLLQWLTQISKDLKGLNINAVMENPRAVFVSTSQFSAWVTATKPLSIPIPEEFLPIVLDRAPEQIRKGKLLLSLVRADKDAVWFKIPLLRDPLKVERKPISNQPLRDILKPL